MAIYSLSVSIVQRSKNQSSVASIAYMTGESMTDKRTGEKHTYSKNLSHIVNLGSKGSDNKLISTSELWSEAELKENRKNSRTARKMIIALPIELTQENHIKLAEEYRAFLTSEYKCAVTIALHYDNKSNPHMHLQMTTRVYDTQKSELKEKIRMLDGSSRDRKIEIEKIRSKWAEQANKYLRKENWIDHRSYKRQGSVQIPTKHLGQISASLEKEGIKTEKGTYNRWVAYQKHEIKQLINFFNKNNINIIKKVKTETEPTPIYIKSQIVNNNSQILQNIHRLQNIQSVQSIQKQKM